jgi:hypothetical protein
MYINYQQDDWSQMLDKAEFTYNNTEHASTKMTPFYANYGYHPLDLSSPQPPLGNPTAQSHLDELVKVRNLLVQNIARAQDNYAKYYNRKVKSHLNLADEPLFKVGDKVWLSARDITTSRPSAKLDHKLLGPFRIIEKISDLVYRLDLPATMDINNTFHISKLERFNEGLPNQPQQEPPPIIVEGERRYVPERILDGTYDESTNQYLYLVHWEGYPNSEDTWEPYEELKHLTVFKKFRLAKSDLPNLFPPTRSQSQAKKKTRTQKR